MTPESQEMPRSSSIGTLLRRAREAQGLSLADVEHATKVRQGYLAALEEERFDALPGRVYAKGYVRAYTHFLGIDSRALLDAFERTIPPAAEQAPPQARRRVPTAPPVVMVRRYLLPGVAIGLGLVGLGSLFVLRGAVPTAPPAVPAPIAGEREPPSREPPSREPPSRATPASIADVTLAVSATGTSWIRVTADGERVFQGLLHGGDARSWTAERELMIRVGNAGAVDLRVNGETLGVLGGLGDVVTRTFRASARAP